MSIVKPRTKVKLSNEAPYPALHRDAARLIDAVNILRSRGESTYATNVAKHLDWPLSYVDKVKRHIVERLDENFQLVIEVPWTVMAGDEGGLIDPKEPAANEKREKAIRQVRKGQRSRNSTTFKRMRIEFRKHPLSDVDALHYAEAAYHQGRDVYGVAYRDIQERNLEALIEDIGAVAGAIEQNNNLLDSIIQQFGTPPSLVASS